MKKSPVNISGISESRVAPVAAYIKKEKGGQGLIIVSSYAKAKRLKTDFSFFYDGSIYVIPEQDEALVRSLFRRGLRSDSTGIGCAQKSSAA